MTSRSHCKQSSDKPRQCRSGGRTAVLVAAIIIATAMVPGVWAYGSNQSMPSGSEKTAPSSETTASSPPDSRELPAASNRLKGRWVRPDGGYVLEISGIQSNGRMEARYYNPRPIHVSQAAVSNAGGLAKVFVELRDTGYPGATYTLLYNPKDDLLVGRYYQPAVGQTFDVIFMRHKPAQ